MSDAPERIYIDRGPNGGWMYRIKRLWDTKHEYIRTDLHQTALDSMQKELQAANALTAKAVERADAAEAEIASKDRMISDLTMLVLRLSKYAPDEKVNQAFDYLHRKGLASPLRSDQEQSDTSEAVKLALVRFWKRLAEVERTRADAAAPARLAELE